MSKLQTWMYNQFFQKKYILKTAWQKGQLSIYAILFAFFLFLLGWIIVSNPKGDSMSNGFILLWWIFGYGVILFLANITYHWHKKKNFILCTNAGTALAFIIVYLFEPNLKNIFYKILLMILFMSEIYSLNKRHYGVNLIISIISIFLPYFLIVGM